MIAGWIVSPRKSRSKSACASSSVVGMRWRATINASGTPAGPPPTTQHVVWCTSRSSCTWAGVRGCCSACCLTSTAIGDLLAHALAFSRIGNTQPGPAVMGPRPRSGWAQRRRQVQRHGRRFLWWPNAQDAEPPQAVEAVDAPAGCLRGLDSEKWTGLTTPLRLAASTCSQ